MSNSPDLVYSLDGEWYDDFDTIQGQVNDDTEPGEKVSGYKGVPIPVHHIDIINRIGSMVELIQDTSYDEDGDAAEDYLMDMTDDLEKELNEVIAKFLDDHVAQPKYYHIGDVQDHIFTPEFEE
jgi:hypothetical protein